MIKNLGPFYTALVAAPRRLLRREVLNSHGEKGKKKKIIGDYYTQLVLFEKRRKERKKEGEKFFLKDIKFLLKQA